MANKTFKVGSQPTVKIKNTAAPSVKAPNVHVPKMTKIKTVSAPKLDSIKMKALSNVKMPKLHGVQTEMPRKLTK